jgi:hypothetical protein
MPAVNEMARLTRDVDALVVVINQDLRPGSKSPMNQSDKRAIKSEIEKCMQKLDELRTKLTGG